MSPRGRLTTRYALAAAFTAILLAACGGQDEQSGGQDKADGEASASDSPEPKSATKLATKTNEAMAATSFHAKGSSTAFEDARQEIWSDPDKGMRLRITAPDVATSEIYCKDSTLYNSPQLLVAQLKQRGEDVTLPADMKDKFVQSSVPGGCDKLYAILPGATLDPELDDSVDGTPTTAIVSKSQGNTDVYQVSKKGDPLMLRMDSTHDDRKSTTVYDSYGEKMNITIPAKNVVVDMDTFQKAVK